MLEELLDEAKRAQDDFVFGKEGDVFVKHARKRNFIKKYGNPYLLALTPGLFAYINMKEDLKNPNFTIKQKVYFCAFDLGCELFLDAVRIAGVYGIYQFTHFLSSH